MKAPDINDTLRAEGTDAVRARHDRAIKFDGKATQPRASSERKPHERKIPLIPFADIKLDISRRDVVRNLIPCDSLIVVWGPPKCGKSFGAFDLCLHAALGWSYRGRRVQQGPVVYCAFEGQQGIQARVEAFRQNTLPPDHSGDIPFYLEPLSLKLVRDHKALIASINAQLGDRLPVIVTLDTLNRSIEGSESSDEDMTKYISAADAIRTAFGCAVIIIHHCGVDGTRPRGHTSLAGAADVQIAVSRGATGIVIMTVEWMKDGDAEGNSIAFRLDRVSVGKNEDGDDISSCIVVPVEDNITAKVEKRPKLSPNDELARRALADIAADQGKSPSPTWGLPNGVQVVATEAWRTTLISRDIVQNDRRRFWDMKNRLKVKNVIAERDELVWLA
jgi:hypothetical protein